MSLAQLHSAQWAEVRHSVDTLMDSWCGWQGAAMATGTAWGTQYRAVYVPVRVPRRATVVQMAYAEGVATGNIDIGIYDAAGTRLVSSGSTAVGTDWESVEVTDTLLPNPGLYYLAFNSDSAAGTFLGTAETAPTPAARGILTETLLAVTLPATASWAVDQTLGFIPLISALLVTGF